MRQEKRPSIEKAPITVKQDVARPSVERAPISVKKPAPEPMSPIQDDTKFLPYADDKYREPYVNPGTPKSKISSTPAAGTEHRKIGRTNVTHSNG